MANCTLVVMVQSRMHMGLVHMVSLMARRGGIIYGGAAMTPGSQEEMSSLRAEHCGAISILLIIYAIQIHLGTDKVPKNMG